MNKEDKVYDRELDLYSRNSFKLINDRLRNNSEVLEFGPSIGVFTQHMHVNRKCTVDIVEYNKTAGAKAAVYARNAFLGIEEGDAEKYVWAEKLAGQKYDFIIFADVLEHLHNPEKILGDCRNFLKDNGVILISVPNMANNNIILSLLNDEFNYTPTGLLDDTHIRFFTYKSLLKMVNGLGYGISYIDYTPGPVGSWEFYDSMSMFAEHDLSFLSNHKTGNMYQLVAELRVGADNKYFKDIPPTYTPCGYYSLDGNYSEETRLAYDEIYCVDDVYHVTFKMTDIKLEDNFRFDPVEYMPCCFKLIDAYTDAGKCFIVNTNAILEEDSVLYFTTNDPALELEIPIEGVTYISFIYKIGKINYDALGKKLMVKNVGITN